MFIYSVPPESFSVTKYNLSEFLFVCTNCPMRLIYDNAILVSSDLIFIIYHLYRNASAMPATLDSLRIADRFCLFQIRANKIIFF